MMRSPALLRPYRMFQSGITLLELTLSISIMGLVIASAVYLLDNHTERVHSTATAQHMKVFADAVQAYIKDNYNDLTVANTHGVPTATATIPAVLTANILRTTPSGLPSGPVSPTRYLPLNFDPVNSYGQTICALILQPKPNEIYTLIVTEGGDPINDIDLSLLTASLGAAGGGIYDKDKDIATGLTSLARGTMSKWQFDFSTDPVGSNFQNKSATNCSGAAGAVNLTKGRPLMALWFANDTSSAFLYRDEVPGHPELNRMQTDLRFKADSTQPDPSDPSKTILIPGASIAIEIVRSADTPCDDTPTAGSPLKVPGPGRSVVPGTLAKDADGNLLTCTKNPSDGLNYWRVITGKNVHWEAPVNTFTDLTALPCNATTNSWQTRIVKYPANGVGPRAYTCANIKIPMGGFTWDIGWRWDPLGIDDSGVMRLGYNNPAHVDNAVCNTNGHGVGSITKDSKGELLVCAIRGIDPIPRWRLVTGTGSGSGSGSGTGTLGQYRFEIETPAGFSIDPREKFIGIGRLVDPTTFSGIVACDPNLTMPPLYANSYRPACGSGGTISCAPPPNDNVGNPLFADQETCTYTMAIKSTKNWGCPYGTCSPTLSDQWHYLDAPLMVYVVNLKIRNSTQLW